MNLTRVGRMPVRASLAVIALAWLVVSTGIAAPKTAPPPAAAPVALLTGSDRGIGLALVEELERRGWLVLAACRDPQHADALRDFAATHPRVQVEALDVADNAAIEALAARYHGQPIDALINNAGIADDLGAPGLGKLDPEEFIRVLRVNTYAPLKISATFLDQVAMSRQKKIIAITSGLGSLFAAPQFKGSRYYSISKAGLNMAMRILQNEARERGILVGIVAPGPVDTDMQRAYRAAAAQAGRPLTAAVLSPAESAHALVDYIENLGADKAGRFYAYNGQEVPW